MFSTNVNSLTSNNKPTSLHNKISFGECSGLNIDGGEDVRGILGLGGRIQSNSGEPELILFIKFKEQVNITGIQIDCFDKDFSPEIIKLYSNVVNLDFSDVQELSATESLNLNNNLGKILQLKLAKFRSVQNLAVKLIIEN
jgi:hypothetical protein